MKAKMTQTQLGVYLACQSPGAGTNYDLPLLYELGPRTDEELARFSRAVELAALARPALLSRIVPGGSDGIPCLALDGEPRAEVSVETAASREDVLEKISETAPDGQKRIRQIDLDGPLYCFRLFQTPEGAYFFINYHHIVMDAASRKPFYADIERAYETGIAPEPERYSIFDVCAAEEQARNSPAHEEDLKWCAEHLAADEFSRFPGAPDVERELCDFRRDSACRRRRRKSTRAASAAMSGKARCLTAYSPICSRRTTTVRRQPSERRSTGARTRASRRPPP